MSTQNEYRLYKIYPFVKRIFNLLEGLTNSCHA